MVFLPGVVHGQEIPPPAYQIAASEAGIPSTVLYAVALQESGTPIRGKIRPWPWTLNVAGKSLYFTSRDAACQELTCALKQTSAKRVDVGLGQINVGYHGERVTTPCDLLDPGTNLSIAATIIKEQHRDGQDWLITMGKYHSPANGEAAQRYRSSARHHLYRVLGTRAIHAGTLGASF
ncbi:lytic transglycosylase domain-containing protein [Saezia sanguinis]|uniref:lytic transglycosylase domain-containing protein n=1 Tax=Saezia sanguinis TaxID=1965230 RepID=UPI0030D8C8A1